MCSGGKESILTHVVYQRYVEEEQRSFSHVFQDEQRSDSHISRRNIDQSAICPGGIEFICPEAEGTGISQQYVQEE